MHKTSSFLRLGSVLSLALAASAGSSFIGCGGGSGGGSGGGGGGTPGCFDYTAYDGTSPAVSFKTDVLPILRTSCGLSSSCHGTESGGPSGQHYYGPSISGPEPTADQIQAIFDQSVSQPAVANPSMNIVTPGDPSKSFLMYKLDGDPNVADQVSCADLECAKDQSCLSAMPQGGPQLPSDKRDIIRRWIAQGAKND